jgi:glucose repression regulatory protein TUP1
MNLSPPTAAGDDLTLQNVPPEFRKEGSDWYAVYNPKVKKSLDVNLVHTFNHAT